MSLLDPLRRFAERFQLRPSQPPAETVPPVASLPRAPAFDRSLFRPGGSATPVAGIASQSPVAVDGSSGSGTPVVQNNSPRTVLLKDESSDTMIPLAPGAAHYGRVDAVYTNLGAVKTVDGVTSTVEPDGTVATDSHDPIQWAGQLVSDLQNGQPLSDEWLDETGWPRPSEFPELYG